VRFTRSSVEQVLTLRFRRNRGGRPNGGWKLRPPRGNVRAFVVRFRHRGRDYELSTKTADLGVAERRAAELFARVTSPPSIEGPGVYAVQSGRFFKIGMSRKNMFERLEQIQRAHAEELVVLGVLSGNPNDERRAQALFAAFHARGEWFEFTPATARLVRELVDFGFPLEATK
jgi:hypothetical protein